MFILFDAIQLSFAEATFSLWYDSGLQLLLTVIISSNPFLDLNFALP